MRHGLGIVTLIAAASLAGAAHAQGLPAIPSGWERPVDADLGGGGNWEFRKDRPDRMVRAEGDYNGDGKADRAELLINRKSGEYGLFAFLAGTDAAIELDRNPLKSLGYMGITTQPPGRIQTACGKGYIKNDRKCERGVPFMDMPNASISYYIFESGGTHWHWTNGKFEEVWTSD